MLLTTDANSIVVGMITYSAYNPINLLVSFPSGQSNWLQLDRRVLDHDFTKKTGPLELKFLVR